MRLGQGREPTGVADASKGRSRIDAERTPNMRVLGWAKGSTGMGSRPL